ncbi:4-hydroxy-tetrahydrodipicolinate reductase [Pleomorphomonas sp. JP5]|uniref:4-hydroxy-tetrahydrodipicolinate reductase n=1 Tax=Pleomorphomonas sp. JP5 TaxID=2942998 RepID=UPI00204452C2|nr:4-hydroxy-tetrahydrodipicolinate reductase [Pleomorphomonas sp. JP5]MCM5556128.1 4-hydroxy-tetrahydrodipicolinate reductase [Pleomorphomonas sp. JP5]
MPIRVIVAGATGWTGSAVAKAVLAADDLVLVGAVARSAAGRDLGEALGGVAVGVPVVACVEEALKVDADVLVDYTASEAVKTHALQAVSAGVAVVIGTSGLSADDYADIDAVARAKSVGVFAAGNYSMTATLMTKFALMAAKYVADVEVIDCASAGKPDTPSGTARELAERLSAVRRPATSKPVNELGGIRETRGGTVGAVQVHSLRMPGYVLSCEAQFGSPGERLLIRHDAGSDAAPYVAGTLLAVRRVREQAGLRRGLDLLID